MATKNEIIEALMAEGGPLTVSDLAKKMNLEASQITMQVARMVKAGDVAKNEAGELSVTEKAKEAVTASSQVDVGATDYEHFKYLAIKIGIPGDLIDVTTEHVWNGGDYREMSWVWTALGEMGIRQDLKQRWWNAWRSYLKQGIPPELKDQFETPAAAQGESLPGKSSGRDYILIEDEPVRVGDGLGDYSLGDAKDIMTVRTLRQRFRPTGGPERQPSGAIASQGGEKVSDLLTALQPYITKGTNMDELKEIVGDKMQLLKAELLPLIPRGSPEHPKTWVEQLGELTSGIKGLSELGPMIRSLLGMPEPSSGTSNPSTYVQLKDSEGNPVTMDIDSAIKWETFRREDHRADEKQGMLRSTVETFRQEWPTLAAAIKETAEGYNSAAQSKPGGAGGFAISEAPTGATCPSCQRTIPAEAVPPEGDVTCPHCRAVLERTA